jgi:DNA repair protein RadC
MDGHRRRIKNKFIKHGLSAFHDYEVLELILTYCIARKDVKPIAKDLLAHFGSFQAVLDAPLEALQQVHAVGEHSAVLFKLIQAGCTYYLSSSIEGKEIISSPKALIDYLRSCMASLSNEQFRVVYLNAKNELLCDEIIQEGTIDQAAVYPRTIVERALDAGAVAIILVHNHPSGDPTPSIHDKKLTSTLVNATKPLSIRVHDHIIVSSRGYYSFAENHDL